MNSMKAIIKYGNGDKYKGQWMSDKKNGFGTYWYAGSGDSYEGDWKNNMK